jgi:hypothetical protein
MNNKKTCAICYKEITALRPLTHYKCSSCMENGFEDKLVCEQCIKKWPNQCPFDRQKLDPDLNAEIIRTPLGTKMYVIVKQKQCCCLKIKKCLKTNMNIIQQLPDCFTMYSWCQAITRILILHISVGFIGYVFTYGICTNGKNELCWVCVLAGILNIIGSILILWLIFGFINDKYRISLSLVYGLFSSLSFIIAISVSGECYLRLMGFVLLIPAFCAWSCCGYNSDLTKCE